jgi:betaine reductase
MNSKKHIEKGFPVLEDAMGAFAILVEAGESTEGGIIIRNDITGIHRIGSGSSPQHVIQNLVADPLEKAGIEFAGVGYYAPELHNPEVTEAGGAGNVTLANLKMIAAMAVMKKQIERTDINDFVKDHGSSGWAPTQGHIPSGMPALGWIARWFESGRINNAMIIGKGSLFLGRMTGLFDGVSILLESGWKTVSGVSVPAAAADSAAATPAAVRRSGKTSIRLGLTIPGSESGAFELLHGASEAERQMDGLEVVTFGSESSDPGEAHLEMEKALTGGSIDAAVTFHYPFPLGTTTVGHTRAPGNGRSLFIASTTGISDTDRVNALVKNTIAGIAAAKAWGIENPTVGILNLDGARTALSRLKRLASFGWQIDLASSARGDELLRGNDILAGSADVIVCDTLSGNAFIKLLGGFSSGGRIEVSGSGYGPGIGGNVPLVNIISRASSSAVTANALIYSARMAGAGLDSLYAVELAAAKAAGFSSEGTPAVEKGPEPKTVNKEIEGIDVLSLDEAVKLLKGEGIYCEAGMGCTGPVVMVAAEDAETAEKKLTENGFIR